MQRRGLVLILGGLLVVVAAAKAPAVEVPGPPLGWEAHPPVHIHKDASASPVGLLPGQVRHAYGFDQIASAGAGQTIAIVDAYGSPTIQNDVSVFCSKLGLPAANLQIASPQGAVKKTDSGWALETSLDVEWAHAIAPAAKILLVVTKSASLTDLLAGVDYAVKSGASQVSMSWGGSEFSNEASYDSHFSKAGVSLFVSSGDNGAGVEWPASSPNVVSVGGTRLTLNSDNTVNSETGWTGSGGGSSAYELEPAYQNAWQGSGKRGVPDVSYDADTASGVAVYDSAGYQGQKGWFSVGGTSAGAPQWAALMALVNAQRATPISGANGLLYANAPANYRDITSGSNGFSAAVGYDYVTGVGSPLANQLIPALVASP